MRCCQKQDRIKQFVETSDKESDSLAEGDRYAGRCGVSPYDRFLLLPVR